MNRNYNSKQIQHSKRSFAIHTGAERKHAIVKHDAIQRFVPQEHMQKLFAYSEYEAFPHSDALVFEL